MTHLEELARLHEENAKLHRRIEELEKKNGSMIGKKFVPKDGEQSYYLTLGGECEDGNHWAVTEVYCVFPTRELAEKASPIIKRITDIINIADGTPNVNGTNWKEKVYILEADILGNPQTYSLDNDYIRDKGNNFTEEQKPLLDEIIQLIKDIYALRPSL